MRWKITSGVVALATAALAVLDHGAYAADDQIAPPRLVVPTGWADLSSGSTIGPLSNSVTDSAGDLLIVGAGAAETAPGVQSGQVYIFRRADSRWTLDQTILPPAPVHGGGFGRDVSTDGTTVTVSWARDAEQGRPAVLLYERRTEGWRVMQTLRASAADGSAFGAQTAMSRGVLAVRDSSATGYGSAGAVDVYDVAGDRTWTRRFRAPGRGGAAFELAADTLVIGSTASTVTSTTLSLAANFAPGAVMRPGEPWYTPGFYNHPAAAAFDGRTLALHDDFARLDDGTYRSRVHVYGRSEDGVWTFQHTFLANVTEPRQYGRSLSVVGDTLLVGSPSREDDAVYRYNRGLGGWAFTAKYKAPTGGNQGFGIFVEQAAGMAAFGAGRFNGEYGAMWSWDLTSGSATYLENDARGAGEQLGFELSADRDHVAVLTKTSAERPDRRTLRILARSEAGAREVAAFDPKSDGERVTGLSRVRADDGVVAVATYDNARCVGVTTTCFGTFTALMYQQEPTSGVWSEAGEVRSRFPLGGSIDLDGGTLVFAGHYASTSGLHFFRRDGLGNWASDGDVGLSNFSGGWDVDLSDDGRYAVTQLDDISSVVMHRSDGRWTRLGTTPHGRTTVPPVVIGGGVVAMPVNDRGTGATTRLSFRHPVNGTYTETLSLALAGRVIVGATDFPLGLVVTTTDPAGADARLHVVQQRGGGQWAVTATAAAQAAQLRDGFGPVTATGDFVAVGAPGRDGAAGTSTGAIEFFDIAADDVAPTVIGVADRAPDAGAWYRSPVLVHWQCDDSAPSSGLTSTPKPTMAAIEGADVAYSSGNVCDSFGNCAEGQFRVSLDMAPPTTGKPTLTSNPSPVGQPVTVTATAQDALSGVASGEAFVGADPGQGAGTPLRFDAGRLTGTVEEDLPPGVYDVGVRARDNAGHWSPVETASLVVFNPEGASVTGGGQVDSPRGSLVADPEATGRAGFTFAARYPSATSTAPSGSVHFRLHGGRLALSSTALSWLVVSEQHAQLRGEATVNGQTGYTFTVAVTDGDFAGAREPDRFRLKVWDGDGLVYDNVPGSASGPDNAAVITGGNVIVQR